MNFGNLEKIESTILRPSSNFVIKNVVLFGKRDKVGMRTDAFNEINYKTNKYSNLDNVSQINIETQDFIVFSYSRYEEKKRILEEIYVSYPHFYKLKNKLEEIYNLISSDEIDIFYLSDKENMIYINPEYEDYLVELDNLIGGKSIGLLFDIKENIDEVNSVTTYEEGIRFVFNNPDNDVTVSLETFEYIYLFLKEFNLLNSSQNLVNIAFMNEIAKGMNINNKINKEFKSGKIIGNRNLNIKKDKNIDDNSTSTKKKVVKKVVKKENNNLNYMDFKENAFLDPNYEGPEEIPFN